MGSSNLGGVGERPRVAARRPELGAVLAPIVGCVGWVIVVVNLKKCSQPLDSAADSRCPLTTTIASGAAQFLGDAHACVGLGGWGPCQHFDTSTQVLQLCSPVELARARVFRAHPELDSL